MAVNRKSLPLVVARVAFFWWCIFTIIAFGVNPREITEFFIQHSGFFIRYFYLLAVISGFMIALVGFAAYAVKLRHAFGLRPTKFMGLQSTLGNIPLPNPPLPRISDPNRRIPLTGKRIRKWLASQQVSGPKGRSSGRTDQPELTHYGQLFLAIWDTFCAHSHYPASHRIGGHGDRRLHDHCHDVAEQALTLAAEGWQYTGIYVKKRGRKARRIMEPNSANSVLNANDPIIPIIALAHDIGKLIAYQVDKNGCIVHNKEEESNTLDDDDGRVMHDMLAPRALAVMPEFWRIDHRDRLAINMALAHYHHPSAFPLDRYQRLLDERAAAVMALLIDADRAVSAAESDLSQDRVNEDMDEALQQEIYQAFVEIVLQPGRINGLGNPEENAMVQIGQKHADFIAIQEKRLRTLMLQKMNWSLEDHDNRYHLTIKLLTVLHDKGLLYVEHGGVDFSAYLPMYKVALYHHAKTRHLADLAPAVVIKIPSSAHPELEPISFMSIHPAKAIIKHPMLTHLNHIKDPERLHQLIANAFDASDIERIDEDLTKEDPAPELGQDDESDTVPSRATSRPKALPTQAVEESQGASAPANEEDGMAPTESPATLSPQEEEPALPSRPPLRRPHERKPLRLTDLDAAQAAQVGQAVQKAIDKTEKRKAAKVQPRASARHSNLKPRFTAKEQLEEQLDAEAKAVVQPMDKSEQKALFGDVD